METVKKKYILSKQIYMLQYTTKMFLYSISAMSDSLTDVALLNSPTALLPHLQTAAFSAAENWCYV